MKNRLVRWLGWTAAGLALCLLLAYAAVLGLTIQRRFKAERLIQDLQALKVGESTAGEVRQLAEKFDGSFVSAREAEERGTSPAEPFYELSISAPYLQIGETLHSLEGPGIRPWHISVQLRFGSDRFEGLFLRVFVERRDEFMLINGASSLEGHVKRFVGRPAYDVGVPHITGPPGEALSVDFAPTVSEQERRRAFDISAHCLTGLFECKHVCELAPSAWNDLPLEQRLHFGRGQGGEVDTYCREVLARRK